MSIQDSQIYFMMVGAGQVTDTYCGNWTSYSDKCPTLQPNHLDKPRKFNCKDLRCPTCYPKKVLREATFYDRRIKDARRAYYLEGVELIRGDMIVSLPASMYHLYQTENGYRKARHVAQRIAERAGLVGAVQFTHPWRGSLRIQNEIRAHTLNPSPGYHHHFDGLRMKKWEKSNDIEAETGIVYKWVPEYRFRVHNPELPRALDHLVYELGHAGIPTRTTTDKAGHAIIPVGILSRRNVARLLHVEESDLCCDACGQQGHVYFDDEDTGVYSTIKKTIVDHTIRPDIIQAMIAKYNMPRAARRAETLDHYQECVPGPSTCARSE